MIYRRWGGGFEKSIIIFSLIAFSGALSLAFGAGEADESNNSMVAQFLQVPSYFYGALIFIAAPRKFLFVLKNSPSIVLITLMCLFSAFWSIEPGDTIKRSFLLIAAGIFSAGIAVRFSREEFIEILGHSFLIISFILFLGVVFFPDIAIHQDKHYPAVRGFFSQKNVAGNVMCLGYIVGLVLCTDKKTRKFGISVSFVSLVVIFSTLSASAIVCSAALSFIFWISGRIKGRSLLKVSFLSFLIIFFGFLSYELSSVFIDDILGVADRNVTLTGRTLIWAHLYDLLVIHDPWLGFGYQSFWTSSSGALGTNWRMGDFVPVHAHNGFIQTMASLGYIGLTFLLLILTVFFFRSVSALRAGDSKFIQFDFLFLFFILFTNLAEYSFLSNRSLAWVVFVYLCLSFLKARRFNSDFSMRVAS